MGAARPHFPRDPRAALIAQSVGDAAPAWETPNAAARRRQLAAVKTHETMRRDEEDVREES
jgi:hypothetical protein